MWQSMSRAARFALPALAAVAASACYQNLPPDTGVVPDGDYAGTVVAYPEYGLGYGCGSPLGYGYGYSPYSLDFGYGYSPACYSPYGYGYGYSPYSLYGYPYVTLYGGGTRRQPARGGRFSQHANRRYGLRPWGAPNGRVTGPSYPGDRMQGGMFVPPGMQQPPTFRMPPLRTAAPITRGTFTPPPPTPRPQARIARPVPPPPPPPRPSPPQRPAEARRR